MELGQPSYEGRNKPGPTNLTRLAYHGMKVFGLDFSLTALGGHHPGAFELFSTLYKVGPHLEFDSTARWGTGLRGFEYPDMVEEGNKATGRNCLFYKRQTVEVIRQDTL